ncbi:MAG: hypothetical protein R6X31_06930 [Anaerolineae bacterium]
MPGHRSDDVVTRTGELGRAFGDRQQGRGIRAVDRLTLEVRRPEGFGFLGHSAQGPDLGMAIRVEGGRPGAVLPLGDDPPLESDDGTHVQVAASRASSVKPCVSPVYTDGRWNSIRNPIGFRSDPPQLDSLTRLD